MSLLDQQRAKESVNVLYVLSGQGDLLWKYRMNDRVRVLRTIDVDKDGHVEIVLGSEDRLNVLQALSDRRIDEYIEHGKC